MKVSLMWNKIKRQLSNALKDLMFKTGVVFVVVTTISATLIVLKITWRFLLA